MPLLESSARSCTRARCAVGDVAAGSAERARLPPRRAVPHSGRADYITDLQHRHSGRPAAAVAAAGVAAGSRAHRPSSIRDRSQRPRAPAYLQAHMQQKCILFYGAGGCAAVVRRGCLRVSAGLGPRPRAALQHGADMAIATPRGGRGARKQHFLPRTVCRCAAVAGCGGGAWHEGPMAWHGTANKPRTAPWKSLALNLLYSIELTARAPGPWK